MIQVSSENKYAETFKDLISFLLVACAFVVFGYVAVSGLSLILLCCIFSVLMMIRSKNNLMLWLMSFFSFFCIYSILMFHWLDLVGYLSLYGYKYFNSNEEIMLISAKCLFLFYGTIYCLFPKNVESSKNKVLQENLNLQKKSFVPYLLSITLIFCVSLYFMLTAVISGYTESPYYEYLIVFYILAFYYSNNKKEDLVPIYILLILNCIFVFASGDRGSAMQFLLVAFFTRFQHRINKKTLVIVLVVGILFLSGIGSWRGYYDFSMSIFSNAAKLLMNNKFTLDTAYAADAAGHCIIRLTQDYTVGERFVLFIKYIAQIFIGGSMFGNDVNLSALSQIKYNYHGGGGLLPYYGYFYLGYLGCVLSGMLIAYYFNKTAKNINSNFSIYYKVTIIYFCSTMTRWLLYSPAPLFRGMLFLLLCVWGMRKLEMIKE